MLQNLEKLKENDVKILDPTLLLEKNIILLKEKKNWSPEELKNYTWFDTSTRLMLKVF
ncbi:MAG: hypothetical protein ACW986_11835 [Promethearchaeota archaeon]|jgi:hypothetical protein